MSPTLTMNPKRKHKRKLLILPMVKSHYPRCLQCFPTQEILTTKTLNPKVTSFVIQVSLSSSSLSKSAKKHLYSSLQLSKSCHVVQIVTRLIRTTQGTTNLILKTCPASRKSCHVFPKSCHDYTPAKHAFGIAKIVTR